MRITADTNVLVRAITEDGGPQSAVAQRALAEADAIVLTIPALCELAWVLTSGYKTPRADLVATMRRLLAADNVVINRPAAQAGLAMLAAGGDFADGAIAYEGKWLGADAFVSFDSQAVRLVQASGAAAQLLG